MDDFPWLLRSWRVGVAGLSEPELAIRLAGDGSPVSKQAVGNWQTTSRRPGADRLDALDRVFAADGVFAAMVAATRTPSTLPASRSWRRSLPGPSGPVWIWIRPAEPGEGVHGTVSWGPFCVEMHLACDAHGILVSSPVSYAVPTLRVSLAQPGWVDVGRGVVPGAIGLPTVLGHRSCRAIAEAPSRSSGSRVGGWFAREAAMLGAAATLLDMRPSHARTLLREIDRRSAPTAVVGPDRPPSSGLPHVPPGIRARRLREGRRLSRAAAAEQAGRLAPTVPVSADQIEVLESGGRPVVTDLLARLDTVYGADGALASEPVLVRRSDRVVSVTFPAYWVGPVWVCAIGRPAAAGVVELRWPPWRRRLQLRSGQTVTTRRTETRAGPLHVLAPAGWTVTAGIGADPGAVNVEEGWTVDGARGTLLLLEEVRRSVSAHLHRTRVPARRLG